MRFPACLCDEEWFAQVKVAGRRFRLGCCGEIIAIKESEPKMKEVGELNVERKDAKAFFVKLKRLLKGGEPGVRWAFCSEDSAKVS